MSTSEPISPTARANDSAAPDRIAGRRAGRMIRRKMVRFEAPSEAAASSAWRSSSARTGCTERTTNGSVMNSSATITMVRVNAMSRPNGLLGPQTTSSARPTTIDGIANGRSISALTRALPGKRSRTRIQATSVPITDAMAALMSAASSVVTIARTEDVLEIESHSADRLWSNAWATTAASGMRTITLR
jgi:hypothetical protein